MFLCGNHFWGVKRTLLRFAGAKIGERVKVVGPIYFEASLSIGDDSWIGRNFTAYGHGNVKIGRDCDFGPEVTILTGSHHVGGSKRRAGQGTRLNVEIGNGNWIGARSTILGDVAIGDGCVVGCCSLVNKDVSSNCLVAGVPGKVVKVLEAR
jgi:maltose O-acetyltransferase